MELLVYLEKLGREEGVRRARARRTKDAMASLRHGHGSKVPTTVVTDARSNIQESPTSITKVSLRFQRMKVTHYSQKNFRFQVSAPSHVQLLCIVVYTAVDTVCAVLYVQVLFCNISLYDLPSILALEQFEYIEGLVYDTRIYVPRFCRRVSVTSMVSYFRTAWCY